MDKELTKNPVLEHVRLLKKHGRLDEQAKIQAIDVLSEPENSALLREYLEEQCVVLADIALNGKPFSIPDETADGPVRFAVADNGQHVGFYPHECHFLIAGQTGCGKSTLLKIIFAQILLKNITQANEEENEPEY